MGLNFIIGRKNTSQYIFTLKKGSAEAKFVIEPQVKLIENHGLKQQELALAEEVIKENRVYLTEHWNLYFQNAQKQ